MVRMLAIALNRRRTAARNTSDKFCTARGAIVSRANDRKIGAPSEGFACFFCRRAASRKEFFFSFDSRDAADTICITE